MLRSVIVLAKIVARDYRFEPGWVGKTLNIPYPGAMTAQDKAANTPATTQVPVGGATIPLTLNKHKYVDFIIEDVAEAQSNGMLMMRYVKPAAIALAEAVENDLFSLYSGLSTSIGVSGTDLTPAMVRTAAKTLDDRKVPQSDRFLVLSNKDKYALLGNSELTQYFANARPEAVREGSLGDLYGFDVRGSQLVSVVAGTPNSTKNLAIHSEAFIMATRPFRDIPMDGTGVRAQTVVDEESGLLIRVMYQYNMAERGARVGFDILYGFTELSDTRGIVVLS